MSRITEELLKKRAEHNDMRLTNLEEVTLHQQNIIKIENLDKLCRHLQILYLQNNIIEKIENISKLKELNYLNLALNNIIILENLEHCESLRKLDLTVNFIDVEYYHDSLVKLQRLEFLREVYLTGNPVTDWKGYREFTIAMLDGLSMLDGKEISNSERILAKQKLDDLKIDLLAFIEYRKVDNKQKAQERKARMEQEDRDGIEKNKRMTEHHPEDRKQMYLDQKEQQDEQERKKNPEKYKEKKPPTSIYKNELEMRQCNEGKYSYRLNEFDDSEYTFFEIEVPRYLETEHLDVNLYPLFVSVRIKGKLTQIKLQDEIFVEKSKIQRSTNNGILSITMPKVNPNNILKRIQNRKKEEQNELKAKEEQMKKDKLRELDEIEKKIRKKDTETFTKQKFQEDSDDEMPDLE